MLFSSIFFLFFFLPATLILYFSVGPKRRTKVFGGKQTRYRLLENKNAEVPLIFVIGDSFAQKYFGFFSKHAKKTISFRTVYSFLPEVYRDNSPDLVIQEVLNMYLLEKPPVNPESIKGARRKALAGIRTAPIAAELK